MVGLEENLESTSLHAQLTKASSRLWMRWDPELQDVLRWTAEFVEGSTQLDKDLKAQWSSMILGCRSQWEKLIGSTIISTEPVNEQNEEDET